MRIGIQNKLLASALVVGLVGVTALSGCTTAARGLGKITANKYAKPQSNIVWVVPVPQLEPVPAAQKKVFISYQDQTLAGVDLNDILRNAAQAQGWQIVGPDEATYRLRARTRYFGEVEPESGGANTARAMGWISGAAVGLGTYALVDSATDNWAASAGAGAAAGGLVGLGMSNASKVREWAMITDFVLEERKDEPISFELLSETDAAGTTTAGVGSSRMGDGGGTSSSTSTVGKTTRQSNYFPHGVRLSAWANQMNMSQEEALPLIRANVETVVKQMLP